MARIIVKNNDWDGARAKLQSSLQAQNADFSAKMKAAFAPPSAAAEATAPKTERQPSLSAKQASGGLPRSRVSR